MKTELFDYELPEDQIAEDPASPRDSSRLLVLNRETGEVEHTIFHRFPSYLNRGDLIVVNDTKVMAARLFGVKVPTGGRVELILADRKNLHTWTCLARPARRMQPGTRISFGDGKLTGDVVGTTDRGGRIVRFQWRNGTFEEVLRSLGRLPLPPYIKKELADDDRYQTVFARVEGAKAAPTAGLHFTDDTFRDINRVGAAVASVTLHVGLGTFMPVTSTRVRDHRMHPETYDIPAKTADMINRTRREGGRIIAVGTTVARTLESAVTPSGEVMAGSGDTSLFISPGYIFRVVDALLTNFHLPRSTLLMMVAAFADRERILSVYREAVGEGYRFYSFGDAMFLF